jgi:hypothetical protein
MITPFPYPTWESAKYGKGDIIQFIQYKNPLVIREGKVVGWYSQDRILVKYRLENGIMVEEASIHLNRIIPKASIHLNRILP